MINIENNISLSTIKESIDQIIIILLSYFDDINIEEHKRKKFELIKL